MHTAVPSARQQEADEGDQPAPAYPAPVFYVLRQGVCLELLPRRHVEDLQRLGRLEGDNLAVWIHNDAVGGHLAALGGARVCHVDDDTLKLLAHLLTHTDVPRIVVISRAERRCNGR